MQEIFTRIHKHSPAIYTLHHKDLSQIREVLILYIFPLLHSRLISTNTLQIKTLHKQRKGDSRINIARQNRNRQKNSPIPTQEKGCHSDLLLQLEDSKTVNMCYLADDRKGTWSKTRSRSFSIFLRAKGLYEKSSARGINKQLHVYASKAHEKVPEVPEQIHSHQFRHLMATHLLEDGLLYNLYYVKLCIWNIYPIFVKYRERHNEKETGYNT